MKKYISMLFVFLMVVMVFFVCNGLESLSNSEELSSKIRVVKYVMGILDNIFVNLKWIVVLINEGIEVFLVFGIKLVGVVKLWKGDLWYDYLKDDMKGVKNVGFEMELNVEVIVELKLDLIIGNKVCQEKIYDQLNVIVLIVFVEFLVGNWKDNLILYVNVVNKVDKGKEVIVDFDKCVFDLKDKFGDQINKIVFVVCFLFGELRIYYIDLFFGIILDQFGFKCFDKQVELFKKQKD